MPTVIFALAFIFLVYSYEDVNVTPDLIAQGYKECQSNEGLKAVRLVKLAGVAEASAHCTNGAVFKVQPTKQFRERQVQ